MLSALAAGAKVDPKYRGWLRDYADATRVYWNPMGPTPGYDVLPLPKPTDRYYDDNAWMCLALIETYEVLGQSKYLDWAKETFTYVWSGWDDKLGGGIYWRESDKASKNTCSNAPSALCAFRLYQKTHDRSYLEKAERIDAWLVENLQDPNDSLFWDNKRLNLEVEPTKWSYNAALPLRYRMERSLAASHAEASGWFRTGNPIADSAMERWFDDGIFVDDAAFAHLLFESLLVYNRIAKRPSLEFSLRKALETLHSERDANGHYAKRWGEALKSPTETVYLMHQAAAARAYFMGAQFLAR